MYSDLVSIMFFFWHLDSSTVCPNPHTWNSAQVNWASTLGSTIPVKSWESCQKNQNSEHGTWRDAKENKRNVLYALIKKAGLKTAFSQLFGGKKSSSATRVQKQIAVESGMVSIRGLKRLKIHLDFNRGNRGNIFLGSRPDERSLRWKRNCDRKRTGTMRSLGPSWSWILGIS